MSVLYHSVLRAQPGVKGGGQMKYYPSVVRERPVEIGEFAEQISKCCTLTRIDVIAALESFVSHLNRYLQDGKIVRLGVLGSFAPNIYGTGEDSPEAVNNNNVQKLHVTFKPSTLFKKHLNEVKFEKVRNPKYETAKKKSTKKTTVIPPAAFGIQRIGQGR